MKKTMILGLCVALIMSFTMLGGNVKAAEGTPQATASVDKTTLKKGDVVTLTVKFPQEAEIGGFYLIKFDNKKFAYKQGSQNVTVIGNRDDVGFDIFTSDSKTTPDNMNLSANEILVLVELFETTTISEFSLQFEVIEDLTATTLFNVSKVTPGKDAKVIYTLPAVAVNPVEAEQKTEPEPETKQEVKTEGGKDSTPKTGVTSELAYVVPVAILSILGIVILEKRKVK